MENYSKQQLQRIKHMAVRPKITDRFGLRILDTGELVCAHGKHVIYPDGTIYEAMMGPGVRSWAAQFPIPVPASFTGEWAPSVWDEHIMPKARQHVAFMQRHYATPGLEKYQLAFMLGLASPLMAFVGGAFTSGDKLPPNGLSVSMYSRQGGRGKTTLMHATMLAYGVPGELSKDMNGSGSTDLGRIASLSMSGSMPMAMDEMGGTKEQSITNLISSIANGSGRTKSTKDGGLVSSARWALICMIATNRSQRDMVASNNEESSAIQYRLLELDVDKVTQFDDSTRSAFTADWAEVSGSCVGALGAVIHRELCAMGAAKANRLVLECVNKASTLVKADQTGRFQYRALGAMLALQLILTRIGLQVFDTRAMLAEFQIAHDSAHAFVKDNVLPTDGLALLEMMLHDLRPHTVITMEETKRRVSTPGYDLPINRLPDDVRVRHVVSTKTSYVAANSLREWCVKRHLREGDIIGDCAFNGILLPHASIGGAAEPDKSGKKAFQYNLLKGMRESTQSRVTVYAFSIGRLALKTGREIDFESADHAVPMVDNVVELGAKKPKAPT